MAAALAGRRLAGSGIRAVSRGLDAVDGGPASPGALTVMAEMGLSLAAHRSRLLLPGDLRQASLVLTMTGGQRGRVTALGTGFRVFALAAFAGEEGDIPDPYLGDLAVYRQCARELDRLVNKALERALGGPDFSLPGRE
jgi:protein-tyrosine phosphatase